LKTTSLTRTLRKLTIQPEAWVTVLDVASGQVTSVNPPFPPGRLYTTVSVRIGGHPQILQTLKREWNRPEIRFNNSRTIITVPIEYVQRKDEYNFIRRRTCPSDKTL